MKDHTALVRSQKHEFNKKGMLRIKEVTYSDSGVYSCIGIFLSAFYYVIEQMILTFHLTDSL